MIKSRKIWQQVHAALATEMRNVTTFGRQISKEQHLGYLRIDGRIILKLLLLKLLVMIGTTFSWMKVGTSDHGNEVGCLTSSPTFCFSAGTPFHGLFNYTMCCKSRPTGRYIPYAVTLQFHYFSICVRASWTWLRWRFEFLFRLHVPFASFRKPKQMDRLKLMGFLSVSTSKIIITGYKL